MAPKKSRRERKHSSSPENHHRSKKRRHRSRSSSEERGTRRRRHNDSSPDSEDGHRHRSHHDKGHRHDKRDKRNRKFENVRVKREPSDDDERRRNDERRRENRRNRPANPFTADRSHNERYGTQDAAAGGAEPPQPKEEPDFALSGKLTEDTNTYRGVVIKYNQPPEARKPRKRWRLYPFKGEQALPMLAVHRNSAYLLGRERLIADIPVDHPSCSKQHAVLQYRLVDYERDDGSMGRQVRPYIIDLGSTNGTYVNNQRIEAERYVQLMEKDVLKFGFSTREYVLLHEKSDFAEVDDYD